MKKLLWFWALCPAFLNAVAFEDIKGRPVQQYELSDIMIELASQGGLSLIERWRTLAPSSFRGLDFPRAYMLAASRLLGDAKTNLALAAYVKAYQALGRNPQRAEAAHMAAFLLYAGDKRPEALFYVNRALELAEKNSPAEKAMIDLKRRLSWRYFSRMDDLPDNSISAIAFDGDDVWIGMWSGGLARYTRSASEIETFTPKNAGLPSYYVRDVLVRPGEVWAAFHSGLALYDKKSASWRSFPQFAKISFKRLIADGDNLYAATLYNGVYHSTNGGRSWKNIAPQKTVLDLVKVGEKLYIATAEQGVYLYEDEQLTSFLPQVSVKSFLASREGLWMGSYGTGLYLVDSAEGKIIKNFRAAEIGSDYIETLARVDGLLWAGTLDAGAVFYDGKKWSPFGLREGLPGAGLTTIAREKEYIWFGTLSGGIGIYLFKEIGPEEALL